MIPAAVAPPPVAEARGFRLETAGDLVTLQEYTEWSRNGSLKTTYHQVKRGTCLVPPYAIKPRPVWRRIDLEAWLQRGGAVLVEQRRERAKRRLNLVPRKR